MMNMAVGKGILVVQWCADDYAYLDFHLWTKAKCNKISVDAPDGICVSIKHGIGLCGGGGHTKDWKHYQKKDEGFKQLSEWINNFEDLNFYKSINEQR
jgi:hypothetical protein